jgi:AraC family transcriptional regulator
MTTIITPSEVPKYVPGAVTAASDGLGWNGVWLRGYRYTGLDVLVPPVRDFTIVSYRGGNTLMERRYEGVWTKTRCGPGDVSLLTRSQQSQLALDRGNRRQPCLFKRKFDVRDL